MTLELIQHSLASSGEHIGDIVWWTLSDARLTHSRLTTVWHSHGLSPDLLPEEPTDEQAFRRAARSCQVGITDKLIRLGKEDTTELVFAIVAEDRLGDGSVKHHQETLVRLDRNRGHVTVSDHGHELGVQIRERYNALRDVHAADDVRRLIVRTLQSFAAVTLREGGGVYWVPAKYSKPLRALSTAIAEFGGSRMSLVPVHRTKEAERAIGDAAQASIEQELTNLRTEINDFLASPPERASTLERRLDAFDVLRNRAQLYKTVLNTEVYGLESQLVSLENSVDALLAEKRKAA